MAMYTPHIKEHDFLQRIVGTAGHSSESIKSGTFNKPQFPELFGESHVL